MTATRLQTGEGETFRLLSMPASKPGDLPEDRDGLLSAENGKNAIHPRDNSSIRVRTNYSPSPRCESWSIRKRVPARSDCMPPLRSPLRVLRYVTSSDNDSEVGHLHPSLDG